MRFIPGTVSSFNQKRHPYYIFAADFRDTSAGVTALHYLCHALNCAGESAFLLNTTASKPGLNVRFLSESDCWHHKDSGVVPIMVYPEIVSGNPYNAIAVVRYMLNRDGFLTGQKIERTGGNIELTFYHSMEFVPPHEKSPEVIQVPVLDDALFAPPGIRKERTGSYLFISRFDKAEIDFSQLPADVEILSIENPKSLEELASIFQTAKVLYSYEISGTCVCAMLAGCPVIYVKNRNLTAIPGLRDYSTDGSAFIGEPGGMERAQATVAKVRKHWQKIKDKFPLQLHNFIDRTQTYGDAINRIEGRGIDYVMWSLFPNTRQQRVV